MSCGVQTCFRSASNPNSATASRGFAMNGTSTSAPGLADGWGAVLDGPGVAALAEDPRPAPISITDSRGGCWTATITEVVSRNRQRIVVRDSGRP